MADTDDDLLVSPDQIATKAGIPLPLTDTDRGVISEAIRDAQADVVAYLGQPIMPVTIVETGCYPWADGWRLTKIGDAPLVEVVSVDPEYDGPTPTGYFTLTYLAGLDTANDPQLAPIMRYIKAAVTNDPAVTLVWQRLTNTRGTMKSVTAEGQSVTFDTVTLGGGGPAGSGIPGALPKLASLDRWRVAGRRVYQARTRYGAWEPA